jgi:hypothetical protein
MRAEQLVEIEHRRDFAAGFGEELEGFGVEPLLLEQPRVHKRGGDVRRKLAKDVGVALGIPVPHAAQDVQHANRLLLVNQRHGHRGSHAGHDFHIAGIRADIAEHLRLLRRDDPADKALRQRQPMPEVSG